MVTFYKICNRNKLRSRFLKYLRENSKGKILCLKKVVFKTLCRPIIRFHTCSHMNNVSILIIPCYIFEMMTLFNMIDKYLENLQHLDNPGNPKNEKFDDEINDLYKTSSDYILMKQYV